MDTEKYYEQINRLQAMFNIAIAENSITYWRREFESEGYSERDLSDAITLASASAGNNNNPRLPVLPQLLQYCKQARLNRAGGVAPYKKAEEEYRHETVTNIVGRGEKHKDPFVRKLVVNTLDLLNDRIDKPAWAARHAAIFAEHGRK